jgi:YfiH family protein
MARMSDSSFSRSPDLGSIPGLVHGFGHRSAALGAETREATRARVSRELAPHGRAFFLRQVHGAAVHHAPWSGYPEGDAAVAESAGTLLAIETADCLPVLIADPRRRAVGAAHAGWRGTAAGVAAAAVDALLEGGSRAADLRVALGPAIGACCYEVGDELRAAFGALADAVFRPGPHGGTRLDVRAANRLQLTAKGIAAGAISEVAECTRCRADRYHSYRRDGPGAGRMVSFVGFSASASRAA